MKVIVDLGRTASAGHAAASFGPKITVLTHSDLDHIGGAPAFFDALNSSRKSELWLPYEWAVLVDAVHALTGGLMSSGSGEEQYANAISQLKGLVVAVSDRSPLSRDLDLMQGDPQFIDFDRGISARAIADSIEASFGQPGTMLDLLRGGFGLNYLLADPQKLAKDICTKAKILRKVINGARLNGLRIRWFSVDHDRADGAQPWRFEGIPGVATLVNAVEVTPPHPLDSGDVVMMLVSHSLTIQNRRALATYLWADHQGAIVWSDGDGSHCDLDQLPWTDIAAMTAPHHGSATSDHDPIWAAANKYAPNIDVILAGGLANQRLHEAFLGWRNARRACGKCRHAGKALIGDAASSPCHVQWQPLSRSCPPLCV